MPFIPAQIPSSVTNLGFDGEMFVLAHFEDGTGGAPANQSQLLYISVSKNGFDWLTLNNGQPVYTPASGVVRDPSIYYDATNKVFYVTHTCDDFGQSGRIAVIKSTNLTSWTFVSYIPSGATVGTSYTWNGGIFIDADGSIHITFAVTTDQLVTHLKIYVVTTSDWITFSAKTQITMPTSQGYNSLIIFLGEDGSYQGTWQDCTGSPLTQHKGHASAITGTWVDDGNLGSQFNAKEGQFVRYMGSASPLRSRWRIFCEDGENGTSPRKYRYADMSSTFVVQDTLAALNMSVNARNGGSGYIKARTPLAAQFFAVPIGPIGNMQNQRADNLTLGTVRLVPGNDAQTIGTFIFQNSDNTDASAISQLTGGILRIRLPSGTDGANGLIIINGAANSPLVSITDDGKSRFTNQILLNVDGGWTSGGILFDRTNPTTCSFIGQYNNGLLGVLLGSLGMVWSNNARNADLLTLDNSGNLALLSGAVFLKSFVKASLPPSSTAGGLIYVSDNTAQATPAFSDGTNWRSVVTGLIIA